MGNLKCRSPVSVINTEVVGPGNMALLCTANTDAAAAAEAMNADLLDMVEGIR